MTTFLSCGSSSASAIDSVRGSMTPAAPLGANGSSRQPPAAISSRSSARAHAARLGADARELGEQAPGGELRVADDRDVGRVVQADRERVGVDLDELDVGRQQRAVARRPVVERRAERDDDVGVADELGRQRRREAAADPDRVRLAVEDPVRDGRRREQRAAGLAEARDRRPGARQHRAAAGEQQRAARVRQQLGGGRDVRRARRGVGRHAAPAARPRRSARPAAPAGRSACSARPAGARARRGAGRARRRRARSAARAGARRSRRPTARARPGRCGSSTCAPRRACRR